jgi:Kdo2-lipid IVA lauroyltransferase/acyltransferase
MNAFLLYGTVNLLTKLLPRRVCYAVARQASGWAYRHKHAVRNALAANLRIVLDARGTAGSESEIEQLVRRNFANFGTYVVDFFQTGRLSPQALDAMIAVQHIEYLQECRAMERGIIGLTAHVGNWELGASVLAADGCRVNVVVRPQPSARLDALFRAQRIRRGVHALSMDDAAASVSACLKRNELVVLLADLDFSRGRRRVPFFGKPARLPRGPAVLAKRTGSPILPAFVLRQADDTFRFRAYPPILPDRSQSVDDIQRRICAVLEDVIADHPDQWFAFDPLWARLPR